MIDILVKILSPIFLPMGVSIADLTFYLKEVSRYVFVLVLALILMIIVMTAAVKVKKGWKCFVRMQALLAFLIVVVICVNGICYGTLYNNISGYLNASKVELADDTVAQSLDTIRKIGAEGIVLAENDELLPLKDTEKLNVFGWASIAPLLGGTGSSASSAAAATDIYQSLENAGFETNHSLENMYKEYRSERPVIDMNGQDLTLPEPTSDYYTKELMDKAKDFSDTALLVIGRCGGEDYDLPGDMNKVIHGTYNIAEDVSVAPENYTYFNAVYENNGSYDDLDEGESYLELSNTEEDLVKLVCSEFDKVILVVNSSNTMELGWVEDYPQIEAVLLAPAPGVAGFDALGGILKGDVNPSGKTADTFARDLQSTPTINNIGNHAYENVDDIKNTVYEKDSTYEGSAAFVNYNEGIYVGYKFYETAAEEGLLDYDAVVKYPFGYGLSYTTFEKKIENFREKADEVTFDVTIKNTGNTAGKDVVEIYYTPPYVNGGIEKASVNLIDFAKTDEIEPGASETCSFTIPKEDFASYDSEGRKLENGGYILEAGEYKISLREDSHNVIQEESFTVDEDILFAEESRSSDQTVAKNQFEDYSRGDFVQLSRAGGFANYEEAVAAPAKDMYEMDDETKKAVSSQLVGIYDSGDYDSQSDEMPVMGAESELVLADLAGASYDDDRWEKLLDKMSFQDMTTLVNVGGWQTAEIKSIEKVATSDCDGPAGLNNFITGAYGTTFPAEVLMGQTWSKKMAEEIGSSMGSEFAAAGNYGWYGPAMNIHRSALGGRNFEYYSEDSVLSGYMASGETQGAAQFGVYPYLKHFALNDQETNRCGILLTYASEQAIREIYLKPFEMAVKAFRGNSLAIMSSFNWIGTVPSCANPNLLNHVLRDEWGFRGMVETDYDGSYGFMITDNCVRNGNDLMLGYGSFDSNKLNDKSATLAIAMRQACKNILYTIVNSGYYSEGTPILSENNMDKLFMKVNMISGVAFGVIELLLIIGQIVKTLKKRKIDRTVEEK